MVAHCKLDLAAVMWTTLIAIVLFNNAQASVFFGRVNEGELLNLWDNGGLDAICQRSFPWLNYIGASRPWSSEIEAEVTQAMSQIDFTKEAFIAARLYPQFSRGWYWPGPAWSNVSAYEFFTDYSEDGQEVNYSHWAANGLPLSSEPYRTRQAVIYNHTTRGWQAVPLTSNVSYVLCEFGIVYPPVTTTEVPPSTTTTTTTSISSIKPSSTPTYEPDDNDTSGGQNGSGSDNNTFPDDNYTSCNTDNNNDSTSCSSINNTNGTTTICVTTSNKTVSVIITTNATK